MKFELMAETAAFGSQYCDLACLIMFCVCVFFFFFSFSNQYVMYLLESHNPVMLSTPL